MAHVNFDKTSGQEVGSHSNACPGELFFFLILEIDEQ